MNVVLKLTEGTLVHATCKPHSPWEFRCVNTLGSVIEISTVAANHNLSVKAFKALLTAKLSKARARSNAAVNAMAVETIVGALPPGPERALVKALLK